jgi:hypothetical protein
MKESEDLSISGMFNQAKKNVRRNGSPWFIPYLFFPLIVLSQKGALMMRSLVENPLYSTLFLVMNIFLVYLPWLSAGSKHNPIIIHQLLFFSAASYSMYLSYLRYFKGIKLDPDQIEHWWTSKKSKFSFFLNVWFYWWVGGIIMACFLDVMFIYESLLAFLHNL